jgi:hypothetical protein
MTVEARDKGHPEAVCCALVSDARTVPMPICFFMYDLTQAAGWGSSPRTTQSRLITSVRRPPALPSCLL